MSTRDPHTQAPIVSAPEALRAPAGERRCPPGLEGCAMRMRTGFGGAAQAQIGLRPILATCCPRPPRLDPELEQGRPIAQSAGCTDGRSAAVVLILNEPRGRCGAAGRFGVSAAATPMQWRWPGEMPCVRVRNPLGRGALSSPECLAEVPLERLEGCGTPSPGFASWIRDTLPDIKVCSRDG